MARLKKQRNFFRLSDADKRILTEFKRTNDRSILTRWYFDWEPHPKQLEWISATGYREKFLTTGSRFGKSEGEGVGDLLVDTMLNPEGIVCNTSITQDQAEIIWNTAAELCANSPRFRHWVDDIVQSPFPEIRLRHGGRLWARSTQHNCKYLRGHNFIKLNYDEIAYGSEHDLEVLKMRLADTGGTFSGTTTPKRKNWYYRECWRPAEQEIKQAVIERRKPRSFIMTGTSYDNPHIDHGYLNDVNLTADQRKQEIMGMFLDADDVPFTDAAIAGVTDADLNDQYRASGNPAGDFLFELKEHDANGRYIDGWDLAKKTDWTVGITFRTDRKPWQLVRFYRFQRKPWPEIERQINLNQDKYKSQVILDTTGIGEATWDHLSVPLHMLTRFDFSSKTKYEALINLQFCMENRLFRMPFIKQVQDELYSYEWDDKALVQDCVMALAVAAWKANTEKPKMTVI